VFSIVAALVVLLLIFWLSRMRSTFLAVAIGLIIGGAIGNVVDRLRFGGVIDFLYFHAGAWYWPAFNLPTAPFASGWRRCCWMACCYARDAPQAKGREDLRP
jgi:signal peptidase II